MSAERNLSVFYICLALVSTIIFLLKGGTALSRSYIEILPILNNIYSQPVPSNDFIYQALSDLNPRYIFCYIIYAISSIFFIDHYTAYYILKILHIIFTPIIFFIVLKDILSIHLNKLSDNSIVILFLFVIGILLPPVNNFFSIAVWPIFMESITAHSLSLSIGLLGIIMIINKKRGLSYFLFFLMTLIHPVIGLCVFVFYILSTLKYSKETITLFISVMSAFLFVLIFFSNDFKLETSKLYEIYVLNRHSHHYLPSYFFSYKIPFGWFIINFILISSIFFFKSKENRRFMTLSFIFVLFYNLSLLGQYIFVEIFKIREFILLGMSRFSLFGFFMIIIVFIIVFELSSKKNIKFLNILINIKFFENIFKPILAVVFSLMLLNIDSPKSKVSQYFEQDFINFIHDTKESTLFLSNDYNVNQYFGLFFNRSVFINKTFPFNEKYFEEYSKRRRFNLLKISNNDLLKLKKDNDVNFIVIEKNKLNDFWNHKKSVFSGKKYIVYKL